jgi:uncharacterized protein YxeA
MKKVIVVVLLLAVLATAGLLYAATVTCPIDGSSAYFTGKTKLDVSGKLLYEYKCQRFGHEFWVVHK